jgi:parallel beta-helix repeat protein
VDGGHNLGLAATAGPVNFAAAVGGTTPLGSLAIGRASAVNAAGRIVLNGTVPGADRTGLTIGAGVNNVTLTQPGSSINGFVGNGLLIQGGSKASTIANFTISGNGESGVVVQDGDSSGTVIRDSQIGGNGFNGVWLNGAVPNVTVWNNTLVNNNNNGIVVSGPATGIVLSGNVVSGSGLTGIRTEVVADLAPSGMTIANNTSTKNQETGIILSGVTDSTVVSNVVTQNRIQGVILTLGAARNQVQGNQISGNLGIGVALSGPNTVGNSILSNSIHSNRQGGIALLQGANRMQVAPRLRSAKLARGRITVAGTITGRVGDVFRIQFFYSLPSDATRPNQVEGRTLIGFRDVRLTKATMAFNAALTAAGARKGGWVTATATRLVGDVPTDTSQFSLGVKVR